MRSIIPTCFEKPFKVKFEVYHQGSGNWQQGTIKYDKKNFIFVLSLEGKAVVSFGERALKEKFDRKELIWEQ